MDASTPSKTFQTSPYYCVWNVAICSTLLRRQLYETKSLAQADSRQAGRKEPRHIKPIKPKDNKALFFCWVVVPPRWNPMGPESIYEACIPDIRSGLAWTWRQSKSLLTQRVATCNLQLQQLSSPAFFIGRD